MSTKIIIGNNSHGFENEHLLVNELNEKKYKELNTHIKKFIKNICGDFNIDTHDNLLIKSFIAKHEIDPETNRLINSKPDFYINLENSIFGISTKMGVGNSVHQEKVESFISWIKNNQNIKIFSENIYDDLRFLIWGDGTLSGNAKVIKDNNGFVVGRFTTTEFKTFYPNKWSEIQYFLTNNREEIIKRALFLGKTNKEVHYIYHGTHISGVWISQKDLLEFNLNNELDNSTFNVGRLSFQIYNSDKKGTPSGRKKRGYIQFKYSNLQEDIQKLMLIKAENIGTYEGNLEEFNFSKLMNRKKKHSFWKYLSSKLDLDISKNYYVVKVEGKKYSKNANKKVMCKTDNYIIMTDEPIEKSMLIQNEYQLTELNLSKIKSYSILSESGISIKQKQSKSFTITKMTIGNFKNAFSPYLQDIDFSIASLVFYCTKSQVSKNYKIASDLKLNIDDFCNYYRNKYSIPILNLEDFESLSIITNIVKKLIKETIEENKELKLSLFTGKGWFAAPYYINFLYSSGQLTNNIFTDYNIDNGSGRSKGKYYITIKPL